MSRIHLLKMITLELSPIHVLVLSACAHDPAGGALDVRNIDGRMEGGRLWRRRLLEVRVHDRQYGRRGVAGIFDRGTGLLV